MEKHVSEMVNGHLIRNKAFVEELVVGIYGSFVFNEDLLAVTKGFHSLIAFVEGLLEFFRSF